MHRRTLHMIIDRRIFTAAALALIAPAAVALAAPAPAPAAPSLGPIIVRNVGRTSTVLLPYRASSHLVWVSATRMADATPFMFKSLQIRPGAAPGGADQAVFTYVADRPGTATLSFGLVPPGKALIGPPFLVYRGPIARRISVKVTAQ